MAISEGGLVELSRAVRDISDNALLTVVRTYVGPILLELQQAFNDAVDSLSDLVTQLKSAELYTLISFVLSGFGITLDNVSAIIVEVQADVNEVFAIFTGASTAAE